MSSAKKRRELNRAAEECDKRKLSMQFAVSQHGMLNLMESVAASEIEELRKQRDELLSELAEYKTAQKDLHAWRTSYRKQINDVAFQRDELLAALKQFLDQDGCPPEYSCEWLEVLRVIDNVKGGAA